MSDKKNATMKFDVNSSAMTVLRGRDMRGKTALITGANSGIGILFNHMLINYGDDFFFVCPLLACNIQQIII